METDANMKLDDRSENYSKFDHFKCNLVIFRPSHDHRGWFDVCGLSVYALSATQFWRIGVMLEGQKMKNFQNFLIALE